MTEFQKGVVFGSLVTTFAILAQLYFRWGMFSCPQ